MASEAQGKYCFGSGVYATEKGRKKTTKGWRYLCPVCEKYYTKDGDNRLTVHGYKLQPTPVAPVAHCAECGEPLMELDYLCSKCRR